MQKTINNIANSNPINSAQSSSGQYSKWKVQFKIFCLLFIFNDHFKRRKQQEK